MTTLTTLLTLLAATSASSQALPEACSAITCTPASGAAHILITRASTEAPGAGVLSYVADLILASCPASDVATNPYPASLTDYLSSEAQGVANLTSLVDTYVTCCPASQLVLLGYSQGAQVTADYLCGTSETYFAATPAYAAAIADAVAAVVLMGDPSFVKGQTWNRGNASNVSYFPRQDNAACSPVAAKMISYCDSGDFYCDNGTANNALEIHESYVQNYRAEAAAYVVSQIKGCYPAQ